MVVGLVSGQSRATHIVLVQLLEVLGHQVQYSAIKKRLEAVEVREDLGLDGIVVDLTEDVLVVHILNGLLVDVARSDDQLFVRPVEHAVQIVRGYYAFVKDLVNNVWKAA